MIFQTFGMYFWIIIYKKRQSSIKGDTRLLQSCAIQHIGEDFAVYKDPEEIYGYTVGDAMDAGDMGRTTRSTFNVNKVL